MRFLALAAAVAFAVAFLPPADASPSAPCSGPNEHVTHDVADTMEDPTHPECGSLTDPCWEDGGRCGGCGPPLLEWIVGPIYCF